MATTAVGSGQVSISLEWVGSPIVDDCIDYQRRIGSVCLTFEDAKNERALAEIPKDVNPDQPLSLPFTCFKRLNETDDKPEATTSDVLLKTLDRIRELKVFVGLFSYMKNNQTTNKPMGFRYVSVEVQIPKNLVIGKLYKLVVSRKNSVLSARVVEQTAPSSESKE